MSIVKNRRNTNRATYNDFTVRTLPKGVAVPLGNSGYECTFCKCVQLKNRYYDAPWILGEGETVYIKAEIEQNATGYIYGHNRNTTGTSGGHSIRKNGTNIEWLNGNTVVATVPWASGVHIYGFAGVMDGTRGCKPSYDGEIISNTLIRGGGYAGDTAIIGGALYGTSSMTYQYLTSTGTWSIRIYEVYAYSYSVYQTGGSSSPLKNPRIYHMYATTGNSLAETRTALNTYTPQAISGVSGSATDVDFDGDGYGIQLGDIRAITGSGYAQLVAVLADDEPLKASPNADTPYKISGKDFAFYIQDTPSGPSSSVTDDMDGELVKGRQPKWSIWNDIIKFGHYIKKVDANTFKYKFNLFRDNFGFHLLNASHKTFFGNSIDILGVFNGYNTNDEYVHAPMLSSSGNMILRIHNGAICNCTFDTIMAGSLSASETMDSRAIFFYDTSVGASYHMVAGNLIPWLYTLNELNPSGADRDINLIFGMSANVSYATGGTIFTAIQKESTPLCKDTSDAVKTLYQSTGFDVSATLNDAYKFSTLDKLVASTKVDGDGNKIIDMVAEMKLIRHSQTTLPSTLLSSNYVDCSSVLEPLTTQAKSLVNPKEVQSSTNYRIMLDEASKATIGGIEYPIGIIEGIGRYKRGYVLTAFSYNHAEQGSSNAYYKHYVYIPITQISNRSGQYKSVWNDSNISATDKNSLKNMSYVAVMEAYYQNSDDPANHFQYGWARVESIGLDSLKSTPSQYPSDGLSIAKYWWCPGKSQDSSESLYFTSTNGYKISHGGNGDVEQVYSSTLIDATNNSIVNVKPYSKFLMMDLAQVGLGDDYSGVKDLENLSVIAHVYPKATAPIFCGFQQGTSWDSEVHCNTYNVEDNGSYTFVNPVAYLKANTSSDVCIYSCVYKYNSTTKGYDESYYVPKCKITVYKNGVALDTFNHDGSSAISTQHTGTNCNMTISHVPFPSGYYYVGKDGKTDTSTITCIKFTFTINSGISAGDSVQIKIVKWS